MTFKEKLEPCNDLKLVTVGTRQINRGVFKMVSDVACASGALVRQVSLGDLRPMLRKMQVVVEHGCQKMHALIGRLTQSVENRCTQPMASGEALL